MTAAIIPLLRRDGIPSPQERCPECDGTGKLARYSVFGVRRWLQTCIYCAGTGRRKETDNG